MRKVFLKISQNSQEKACNFIKKRLWHRCFLVNFAKFLRTPFFTEHPAYFAFYSFAICWNFQNGFIKLRQHHLFSWSWSHKTMTCSSSFNSCVLNKKVQHALIDKLKCWSIFHLYITDNCKCADESIKSQPAVTHPNSTGDMPEQCV